MGNQKYPEYEQINDYMVFFHVPSQKWVAERSGIIHAKHHKREHVVAFARSHR